MSSGVKIGHLYPMKMVPTNIEKTSKYSPFTQTSIDGPSQFKQALDGALLKFSHHAEIRMAQRGIHLPTESLSQISQAVDDAASKGAKDSLIVYRDIAMIVNVPSRTVVTAMEGGQMKSNLFTQIDSAIILS